MITALAVAAALVAAVDRSGAGVSARPECAPRASSSGYAKRVDRALRARQDAWGNALLRSPDGPTYEGAARYLGPLVRARGARGVSLTDSGVHYVAFSGQVGPSGADSMALHIADGGQIISQRASGRSLTIGVGSDGRERYGACLARLATPQLGGGYLPILETSYVDSAGVRYRQESFAVRIPETRSLVSFVELTVIAGTSRSSPTLRFTPSERGLVRDGNRLVRGDDVYLVFGPGAAIETGQVTYHVPAGSSRTVRVAWLNTPAHAGPIELDGAAVERRRSLLTRYWTRRLAEGMAIDVPERRVLDARRALLVQSLALTWRYSVGNPYQQFSYPEGIDVAQSLSSQGFQGVARAILFKSLATPLTRYANWKMGQKLVGSALYYRLFRDRAYIERTTPALRRYVGTLGRQIRSNPRGILERERFSSDIKDSVYGLHSQAVVWQGLSSMAAVWDETGHRSLAAEARRLSQRLHRGLHGAVRESQKRLADGSLFLPARLLDDEKPYGSVTESRAGGYWNLVAPYAFASGLFPSGSVESVGALRYMLLHGSRLLGLVRAGAYSLYGLDPAYPTSGINPVYGVNVSRFLADLDRPDQLVLSLYGQLAAGMAPGTFVSGEGLSVTPLGGEYVRTMYLPPNGASNGTFLETLRLMLVHETRDSGGTPRGLQLAFATPRSWLEPGKEIVVRGAPTSFGEVSLSLRSSERLVRASITVPRRPPPRTLALRLRVPRGARIARVTLNGQDHRRFDARTGTIDLSGRSGRLELVARVVTR